MKWVSCEGGTSLGSTMVYAGFQVFRFSGFQVFENLLFRSSASWFSGFPGVQVFSGFQVFRFSKYSGFPGTRVARVRAEYPNQLDYSGSKIERAQHVHVCCFLLLGNCGCCAFASGNSANGPVAYWIRRWSSEPKTAG